MAPEVLAESADATEITVTATLNGAPRGAPTTVTVSVGSGTAMSGTDFEAVADITVTIPGNAVSHTGAFDLDPIQDTTDEADETVNVTGTTTVTELSVTGTTVAIADDDAAPTVTLSLSSASIGEDGGVSTVTATLDRASGAETRVTVSVVPDAPAQAADFTLSTNAVLTIAAGATASTGTVTVTAVDNDVDAADKTVQVKGAAVNSVGIAGPADVELTLADDDTRGVRLSRSELEVGEGGQGTYTVVLDSQPTAEVTVTPSRRSGDTDVTVSGALTFTAGNWDTAQTVTVSAAEDADANDDRASIGHAVAGGDYGSETAGTVSVTVNDDETASDTVTLSVAPEVLAESADATEITVTATLNGAPRGAPTTVTVSVGSGTAMSGTDFEAVADITVTIPGNAVSHTGAFDLDPIQDTTDEADETVNVTGTTTVTELSVTGTTVRIADDDEAPTVTLALSSASIGEDGGVSTVTASLSHASSVATTVTVSVAPDAPAKAADFTLSTNAVLSIAAGQTASTGAVTVTAVDNDVDAADKTVQVKGAAANSLGIAGPADVTLTLEDDDAAPTVTLSLSSASIGEDGGVSTVTASLDHPSGAETRVTVSVVADATRRPRPRTLRSVATRC